MNKLEIINAALLATGVSPVSTYDSLHPDVQNVDPVIDDVNRKVQMTGWWFNTDYNLDLLPDVTGKVIIPSNTLSIDPVDPASRFVQRGQYMYDTVAHTFNINETIRVKLISLLNIEDLPVTAAMYVKHRAVYEFFINDDGDTNKARYLLSRSDEAWVELKKDHLRNSDVNSNYRPRALEINSRLGGVSEPNPDYAGG